MSSINLLSAPVGRKSRVDREIQLYCQSGWARWRPSGRGTQKHTILKVESNLLIHKTDPLDTLGIHLPTQIDSFDFGPNSKTSYMPGGINHNVSDTVAHCWRCQCVQFNFIKPIIHFKKTNHILPALKRFYFIVDSSFRFLPLCFYVKINRNIQFEWSPQEHQHTSTLARH